MLFSSLLKFSFLSGSAGGSVLYVRSGKRGDGHVRPELRFAEEDSAAERNWWYCLVLN
jgi:hypothetical protein